MQQSETQEMDVFRANGLPWLTCRAADSDVVISSRIRLARNFRKVPFPNRADFEQLAAVLQLADGVMPVVEQATRQHLARFALDHLTKLQRDVLIDKRLITNNLAKNPQDRAVYISDDASISLLVNEEDHLRIACRTPGLALEQAYETASAIDDAFESRLDIAFDEKMGYLTSCPTNLGTGLRASVVLHLPGLVFTRNITNIVNISQQLGLTLRGLYSDDKEVYGNLFRVSNQLTLGFSEQEIIDNLKSAVKEITANERRARKALALYMKEHLEDDIWRAYGTLKYARLLTEKEVL
ncbi:ATP--guanido phosphotransferase, partial [Selenomonas sp.]